MARRRPEIRDDVELFPFLDILACLIGCLTLMITALILEMDNTQVARAEEAERVYAALSAARTAVDELQQTAAASRSRHDTARAELVALRQELDEQQARVAAALRQELATPTVAIPTVDAEKHRRRAADIQQRLAELARQIQQRQAALAARPTTPAAPKVEVHPSGSGVGLKPVFVECHARGITLLDNGGQQHPVPASQIATDKPFVQALQRVAKDAKSSIIFLVRSDALHVYNAASKVAQEHYARYGKLPLPGAGQIDLSRFEGK